MSEKILFCGDLVLPFGCKVDYEEVKALFEGKVAIANLEGAILPNKNEVKRYKYNDKFSLYSCFDVLQIITDLNIKCVSLCNNHILDYQYPIKNTEKLLAEHGVKSFGLNNPDSVELQLNGRKLFVITFATYANEHSLSLLNPKHVIEMVKRIRTENASCLIAIFPHWGIEKLRLAEPADRQLAHQCIDAGADIVVGHHPHILQDIEIYKGKHIVYSIGNFILPQTFYGKRKLVYKDLYIQNELVVEWDGETVRLHHLYFDVSANLLRYMDIFPHDELYARFTPPIGTNGSILSQRKYTKIFLRELPLKDIVFHTRLFATRAEEIKSYILRRIFRFIRKTIIAIGLHHPYRQ